MDLESRIDEQEGKIDALLDEIDGRDKIIRGLQAQAAAMREALEAVPEMCICAGDVRVDNVRGLYEQAERDEREYQVMLDKWAAALASDAGKALMERLVKAEAERVTATSFDSYCRDSGCIPYQEGAWMACEACDLCDIPRYHDYLRSNHMIREAE